MEVILLLIPVAILYVIGTLVIRSYRNQSRVRGFEVKLNAGEEPAMKEKENDHG
jgi:hypothetical protein